MKLKVILAALIVLPLTLTACSKKDKAADAETAASTVSEANTVSAEQQAAIDAIDKPVMDEKNTDVPAEKANAPADPATPATE